MLNFRPQILNLQRLQDFLTRALKRAPQIWSMVQKLKMRTRWWPGRMAMFKEGRGQGRAHGGPSVTSAGENLSFATNLKIHVSGLSSLPTA